MKGWKSANWWSQKTCDMPLFARPTSMYIVGVTRVAWLQWTFKLLSLQTFFPWTILGDELENNYIYMSKENLVCILWTSWTYSTKNWLQPSMSYKSPSQKEHQNNISNELSDYNL
jgi:hypothetical protein